MHPDCNKRISEELAADINNHIIETLFKLSGDSTMDILASYNTGGALVCKVPFPQEMLAPRTVSTLLQHI